MARAARRQQARGTSTGRIAPLFFHTDKGRGIAPLALSALARCASSVPPWPGLRRGARSFFEGAGKSMRSPVPGHQGAVTHSPCDIFQDPTIFEDLSSNLFDKCTFFCPFDRLRPCAKMAGLNSSGTLLCMIGLSLVLRAHPSINYEFLPYLLARSGFPRPSCIDPRVLAALDEDRSNSRCTPPKVAVGQGSSLQCYNIAKSRTLRAQA